MALGGLEGGRGGFVQDDSGGIALYLDAPAIAAWPAGTHVRAAGTVASRYGQRTIKLAEADLSRGESLDLPEPLAIPAGEAGEGTEGLRVRVTGVTVGSPSALAELMAELLIGIALLGGGRGKLVGATLRLLLVRLRARRAVPA